MKRQERNTVTPPAVESATPASLSELRALRQAQKATNQRVEELKVRLFRVTEQHMDQAVSLIRRWMHDKNK